MDIQIKVPVKPYIKNYLLSLYQDEPLVLSLNSNCLVLDKLYDLLSRPTRKAGKQLENLKSTQGYTATIAVKIKSWPVSRNGLHLSEEKIKHFNVFVDKLIKDRLFTQLDTMLSMCGFETYPSDVKRYELPVDIKHVILRYMDYHNLEEGGMKWGSLRKAYDRFRAERSVTSGNALSVPLFHVPHNAELVA